MCVSADLICHVVFTPITIILASYHSYVVNLNVPECGRDSLGVAAEVPLADGVGPVAQGAEVLGQGGHLG